MIGRDLRIQAPRELESHIFQIVRIALTDEINLILKTIRFDIELMKIEFINNDALLKCKRCPHSNYMSSTLFLALSNLMFINLKLY